jgi:galactitol-specific phosphotransferase system IIC component
MADPITPSQPPQSMFLGPREQARIKRGNDALVRVCMIAFGVAIAAIAPVTWGWKIALFLMIVLLVGIIMPAISRARRNPY